MDYRDPERTDPLDTRVGRLAHAAMTSLEAVLGEDYGIVLILTDPRDAALAIESGGFDEPDDVVAAVRFAVGWMTANEPTDVTHVHPSEV